MWLLKYRFLSFTIQIHLYGPLKVIVELNWNTLHGAKDNQRIRIVLGSGWSSEGFGGSNCDSQQWLNLYKSLLKALGDQIRSLTDEYCSWWATYVELHYKMRLSHILSEWITEIYSIGDELMLPWHWNELVGMLWRNQSNMLVKATAFFEDLDDCYQKIYLR